MKSFTFWANYHDVAVEIAPDQQGEFYRAVVDYMFDGTDREAELPFEAKIAFKCVKPSLKRSKTKSENGAARAAREGSAQEAPEPAASGNAPARTAAASESGAACAPCASETEAKREQNASENEARAEQSESETQASLRLSSSSSSRLSSSSREGERACAPAPPQKAAAAAEAPQAPAKARAKPFRPPSASQVEAYASEQGLSIDATRFCDFYASKGWTVGRSPMKDWRAAARNWAKRDLPARGAASGAAACAEGGGYDFAIYG